MTASKLLLSAALLLGVPLAGQLTFAQAPTGSITSFISASTNSIWDASLLWPQLTNNAWGGNNLAVFAAKSTNDALQVSLTNAYTLNGSGLLSGRGTNDLTVSRMALTSFVTTNLVNQAVTYFGQVYTKQVEQVATNLTWTDIQDLAPVVSTYVTSGSITGSKGNALAKFMNRSFGEIQFDGATRRISTTKAYWVSIPADGSPLRGTAGNLIALTGKREYGTGGVFNTFNPFSYAFGGGGWTLVLNFDPAVATATNRLSGNATVTLSSQAVYPFHFTGRYIPTVSQSQLLLSGLKGDTTNTFDARGATLSLTLSTNGTILKMLGRICGQAILQR